MSPQSTSTRLQPLTSVSPDTRTSSRPLQIRWDLGCCRGPESSSSQSISGRRLGHRSWPLWLIQARLFHNFHLGLYLLNLLRRPDFLSGSRTVPTQTYLCKRVSSPHIFLRSTQPKRERGFRINDLTVPYVTASIEAEDPFLNHATNGIDMYDISDYRAPNPSQLTRITESFMRTIPM